jgi:quinol monooxygenase YgiN
MISLIARLTVKDGKADDAVALLKELVKAVAKEEGTLFYTVNQDKKKPNEIVVMERYTDHDALAFHSSTDHFKRFNQQIAGLMAAEPVIEVLDEILSI